MVIIKITNVEKIGVENGKRNKNKATFQNWASVYRSIWSTAIEHGKQWYIGFGNQKRLRF